MKKKDYIEVEDLPLSEWLQLLENSPEGKRFANYRFPSRQHKEEYIASIDQRDEAEVISLIRHFLIPSISLGNDKNILDYYLYTLKNDLEKYQRLAETEFIKRLLKSIGSNNPPPWEGITWVFDLLPGFPRKSLEVLNAYLLAHVHWLPDGRIDGLEDAIALIRKKFIGEPDAVKEDKIELLHNLDSREFECLVERLYNAMGYDTELTPQRFDGGRDVIARQDAFGRKEEVRIECKKYSKSVGVGLVRNLLGVVTSEKASKGVLVTSSKFTKFARDFARLNPRIELVSGTQLFVLLNEYLGLKWEDHLTFWVTQSLKKGFGPIGETSSIQEE